MDYEKYNDKWEESECNCERCKEYKLSLMWTKEQREYLKGIEKTIDEMDLHLESAYDRIKTLEKIIKKYIKMDMEDEYLL